MRHISFKGPRHAVFPILLCSLVTCGMTGCGSSSATPPQTLRIALTAPWSVGDPARADTPASQFIATLLFSGLVKFSPDLHVIPELAVSIPTISSGGGTYTFTIRQDARFADGSHCTAADVAFSLARALLPSVHSRLAPVYLGNIEGADAVERGRSTTLSGVSVINRLTVQIRLNHPDATFLQRLAFPVAYIVERSRAPGALLGTGPWQPEGRSKGGEMTFVRRPHFYGGPLRLRALKISSVRDDEAGLTLYRKRAVDVAPVPLARWNEMHGRSDFHQSDSLDAYWAIPDARDRAVLASTLDRAALISSSGLAALSELSGIVPAAIPDYVSSPPSPTGSTSSTRTLPVRLQVEPRSDPALRAVARALAAQWDVKPRAPAVILLHAQRSIPDPIVWLRLALPYTHSGWFHRVLRRSVRLTNDPVSRMNLYSTAEDWALEQGLVIPLAQGATGYLIRSSVQDVQVTPTGIMPANNNWTRVSVT